MSDESDLTGWDYAGTAFKALGSFAQGMNQNKSLRFQADQIEQKANTARAIGSRQMQDMRRKNRMAISNMIATMAGQGGAQDPAMIKMQAKMASRIETAGLMQKWMQDTKGQSLDLQAKSLRRQAKIAKGVGLGKAVSSVMSVFGKGG